MGVKKKKKKARKRKYLLSPMGFSLTDEIRCYLERAAGGAEGEES